jgi:DHA1 family tetracycline resistance protein-like MFS transporter
LLAIAGLMVDYVFSALAPTIFWLFVGRVIAGAAGSSYVIANAFLADITAPEDRAKAFGMMGAAFGLGFVIGPAIGGLLGELGPRVPFWTAAAISGLNLVFGYFVLPETLPPEKRRRFNWRRANPFGAFVVFRTYGSVLPLCGVLTLFFFASSVYPAIWPFWGIARFGWSEAVIGATLAAFGIMAALTQGLLAGPLTARYGERRIVYVGLVFAFVAAIGYGLAWSLPVVLILLVIHAPEGLVHPMLVALMSRAVPDDAQGELQGGISSLTNLAMLAGTLFYSHLFAAFLRPTAPIVSPVIGFFVAGGLLFATLVFYGFVHKPRRSPAAA